MSDPWLLLGPDPAGPEIYRKYLISLFPQNNNENIDLTYQLLFKNILKWRWSELKCECKKFLIVVLRQTVGPNLCKSESLVDYKLNDWYILVVYTWWTSGLKWLMNYGRWLPRNGNTAAPREIKPRPFQSRLTKKCQD